MQLTSEANSAYRDFLMLTGTRSKDLRSNFFRINPKLLDCLGHKGALDLPLLSQRIKGRNHHGLRVHLKEPPKPRARVAAAKAVRAESHQTSGDPRRDLIGNKAHKIGHRDERALLFCEQGLDIGFLRRLGWMQHVPAFAAEGVSAKLLVIRRAPHVGGDVVLLFENLLRRHRLEGRPVTEAAHEAGALVTAAADLLALTLAPSGWSSFTSGFDGQRRGRGRPRKYGKNKISLAKRAGQQRGWDRVECMQYGKKVLKTIKTFLATWEPVGGVIRVVLVREARGWVAFFCTDPTVTVEQILETMADRGAIEQMFKDVKEIWGAGQQQVRNVYASVGAMVLNLTLYTLVEVWSWSRAASELAERRSAPWDQEERRPSHADKRRAWQREILAEEIQQVLSRGPKAEVFQSLADRLLHIAA